MTAATFTLITRSNAEIAAVKAEIAKSAKAHLEVSERILYKALGDEYARELPLRDMFAWDHQYVSSSQYEAAVIVTAWWLAGNRFSTSWTAGSHTDQIWSIETQVQSEDCEVARRLVDEALDPLWDTLADAEAINKHTALMRWQQYTSAPFQAALRRMDEAAAWGRAPERGTQEWALQVSDMLLED